MVNGSSYVEGYDWTKTTIDPNSKEFEICIYTALSFRK